MDSPQGLVPTAESVADPPLSDVRLKERLTDAEMSAFMGHPDTQARILVVVTARLNGKAPRALIDELVQRANLRVLTSKWRPRSMTTAMGWLGTVTKRTVVDYFRSEAVHAMYLQREVEVEDLAPAPDEHKGSLTPSWLLTEWLAPLVAASPRDQETYELLVYKAHTGKTHAQVAADHGMTEGALKSRIFALKATYEPRWRRRQRNFAVIIVIIVLGVATLVTAWLLSRSDDRRQGVSPPSTDPILDRVFGKSLPVSHPRPPGQGK